MVKHVSIVAGALLAVCLFAEADCRDCNSQSPGMCWRIMSRTCVAEIVGFASYEGERIEVGASVGGVCDACDMPPGGPVQEVIVGTMHESGYEACLEFTQGVTVGVKTPVCSAQGSFETSQKFCVNTKMQHQMRTPCRCRGGTKTMCRLVEVVTPITLVFDVQYAEQTCWEWYEGNQFCDDPPANTTPMTVVFCSHEQIERHDTHRMIIADFDPGDCLCDEDADDEAPDKLISTEADLIRYIAQRS